MFDVKAASSGSVSNLAATALPLAMHTDNPYRMAPPGVQLLHCIAPSPCGGGATLLCDGFAAAEELRSRDRSAFDALRCNRIFRYIETTVGSLGSGEAEADLLAEAPPIAVDERTGAVISVRFNDRSVCPPGVSHAEGDRCVLSFFLFSLRTPSRQRPRIIALR